MQNKGIYILIYIWTNSIFVYWNKFFSNNPTFSILNEPFSKYLSNNLKPQLSLLFSFKKSKFITLYVITAYHCYFFHSFVGQEKKKNGASNLITKTMLVYYRIVKLSNPFTKGDITKLNYLLFRNVVSLFNHTLKWWRIWLYNSKRKRASNPP